MESELKKYQGKSFEKYIPDLKNFKIFVMAEIKLCLRSGIYGAYLCSHMFWGIRR